MQLYIYLDNTEWLSRHVIRGICNESEKINHYFVAGKGKSSGNMIVDLHTAYKEIYSKYRVLIQANTRCRGPTRTALGDEVAGL